MTACSCAPHTKGKNKIVAINECREIMHGPVRWRLFECSFCGPTLNSENITFHLASVVSRALARKYIRIQRLQGLARAPTARRQSYSPTTNTCMEPSTTDGRGCAVGSPVNLAEGR